MAAVTDLLNQPLQVWQFMCNAIAGGCISSGQTATIAGAFGGFGVSTTAAGNVTFTWNNPMAATPVFMVSPISAGTTACKAKIVATGVSSLAVAGHNSAAATADIGYSVLVFGQGTGTNIN
jgi:hypothetical protein